jgi:GGDEF domain-containing protein
MDALAAGLWGAFFATAGLMLAASLAAFVRMHRRVALMAALSAVVSGTFVAAYLGCLPLAAATEARVLAHLALVVATTLAMMLLALLGLLRQRKTAMRTAAVLLTVDLLALGAGWSQRPEQALLLSSVVAFLIGATMWLVAVRAALRGDRLAWMTVSGVGFMLVSLAGLSWIALHRTAAGPAVHGLSAIAGMAYLSVMATALWLRYAYLLELAEVMAHGPSYDPVTRMRSHSETGQLVGDFFFRREGEAKPVGVIAICIGNLYALENLHGRAAFNHALFICASRLRRLVPESVEMGRLGEDGFLLLSRDAHALDVLALLALQLRDRLSRPVSLSTSPDPARIDAAGTAWTADVGIGVLSTLSSARPSQVVSASRAMARTGWSYTSRLAFFDEEAGQISELASAEPELRVA